MKKNNSWYKELSKACLNLAVLAIAVFIFGFVTSPNWKWWYFPIGTVLAIWLILLSKVLWEREE